MLGAIIGDIVGAPYEFDHNNIKTKDFPFAIRPNGFTDDSVMTIAVGKALMNCLDESDENIIRQELVIMMQDYGKMYPNRGYGGRFGIWLTEKDPKPYNSFGNGSAMRVSAAGWLYDTLEKTLHMAELSAEVTHNHPEGIKGAKATAACIFLARTGKSKEEIKDYVEKTFGYDLSRTCDEIRPHYHMDETCQGTVPEAITAFLEGEDFRDVIKTAVSLGGDSDTLAAIAGSIAEAFYGVPDAYMESAFQALTPYLANVVQEFRMCSTGAKKLLDHTKINTHSSIHISLDKEIYFDPFKLPAETHNADLIFFTHSHFDHFSPEDFRKAANETTVFVAPLSMKEDIRKQDIPEERVCYLCPGEERDVCGIHIKAVPAYNTRTTFHPKENGWLGYVVTIGKTRVYVCGDTDRVDEAMSVMCDVLFVPVGGTYTMDAHQAVGMVEILDPVVVVPTHYGSIVGDTNTGYYFVDMIHMMYPNISTKIYIK